MIKYIAKSANASIHHVDDWVKVDQSESTPSNEALFEDNICTFPSAAFIRVFYEKIGQADSS